MKLSKILLVILVSFLLTACTSSSSNSPQESDASQSPSLLVSGGELSKSYTRNTLEELTSSQANFKDVTYLGVSISALLQDAGFDLSQIKAVKAVASDGYTVNYDPSQLLAEGIILAYARADGDLLEDDGSFRLVLPDAEGKLNVRMLVELQIFLK